MPKYYEISEAAAKRAKDMNSYSDYAPGSATAGYRAMVDEAYALAEKQKAQVDPMYHDKIDALVDRYARRLAENLNERNAIDARVPSILITGGGNFPMAKKAKQKLRRYAEQAGYTIVGVAAEHGSGLTLDRPALQELTEAVLAGKVDVVLVNSLDRLGRDWGMTKQYIDLLTEHKVKLLCVRERVMIDSSSFSPFFT